ncbi:MAG TPA: TonB-dependent receptor [Phnomibacter sp.]|nr:TonB-dependent receptor [Phnomibacter sp.]
MLRKKLFLVEAALCCASALSAQTADSVKTAVLDEVTITANRLPQKQSATGKVVSIITRPQIEQNLGKTVGQLLNEQAGITIAGALNNPGTPQTLFMRGANAGRALILVDGVPVYDPSLINNEMDLNLFNLNDIERIEICRGAQSTLYGSDAVAGVVNIITVKQDMKKPLGGKATASYGSFNTWRANVVINGALAHQKLSYNLRYARLQTNGFGAAYDSTGKQGFDNDFYRGQTWNAALKYQATDAFALRAFVQQNQYKTGVDASAFTDDKDFTASNKMLMAGTGFTYKKGAATITGNYMYSHLNRNYLNDSFSIAGFTKYSTDDYYGRNQFAEVYTSITVGSGITALYGVDYRFSNMNNRFFSVSSFGPFTSFFRDTSISQGSMYASLLYNTKKLNLELGGRLNVHQLYGSNTTYTFNPSYSFGQHWRLFGSIATGFKAPSLYQMYSSAGNRQLKAEQSINYELGLQYSRAQGGIRVVYFNRDIDNGIDYNNATFRYFNIIKQKVQGLEVEAQASLTPWLQWSANYTLLDAKEQGQSRITVKDTTYSYLLRRPRHHANTSLQVQPIKNLTASLQAKYVSLRYDAGGYRVKDVPLQSYWLLGISAQYSFSNTLKAFADIQNLTNKTFFDLRGYNSLPRLANIGFTVSW